MFSYKKFPVGRVKYGQRLVLAQLKAFRIFEPDTHCERQAPMCSFCRTCQSVSTAPKQTEKPDAERAADDHRDEPSRQSVFCAGLQGHRLPDSQDCGKAGRRPVARPDCKRHYPQDAGLLRALHRLCRHKGEPSTAAFASAEKSCCSVAFGKKQSSTTSMWGGSTCCGSLRRLYDG